MSALGMSSVATSAPTATLTPKSPPEKAIPAAMVPTVFSMEASPATAPEQQELESNKRAVTQTANAVNDTLLRPPTDPHGHEEEATEPIATAATATAATAAEKDASPAPAPIVAQNASHAPADTPAKVQESPKDAVPEPASLAQSPAAGGTSFSDLLSAKIKFVRSPIQLTKREEVPHSGLAVAASVGAAASLAAGKAVFRVEELRQIGKALIRKDDTWPPLLASQYQEYVALK